MRGVSQLLFDYIISFETTNTCLFEVARSLARLGPTCVVLYDTGARTTMVKKVTFKICVVGPKTCGKTLLCKLLAEQVCHNIEYQPTAGLRIQELELMHKGRNFQVQLWDCSGDPTYEKYFNVLAKNTNGVLLVHNACKDQESELEVFYRLFAQPNKLAMSQVAIIGTTLGDSKATVPLQRKLKSLDHFQMDLSSLLGNENSGRAMSLLKPKLDSMFDTMLG